MFFNNRGFSLLEAIAGVVITGLVAGGAAVIIQMQTRVQRSADTFGALDQLRAEIISSLRKKSAWNAIVADTRNPSLGCLRPKLNNPKAVINCKGAGGTVNAFLGVSGNMLVDTTTPTKGLTFKGQSCEGFGGDSCPLRYVISWEAGCAGGKADDGCSDPDVIVTGNLQYAGTSLPLNPMSYHFRLILPRTENESLRSTCEELLLGIYNETTQKCDLNLNNVCTQADEYLVGFQANGSPVCEKRSIIKNNCSGGTVLSGVKGDGSPICTPNQCI